MKYLFCWPPGHLRHYVQRYWHIQIARNESLPTQRIIPGMHCTLIIQVGEPAMYRQQETTWSKRESVGFVEGQFDRSFILRVAPGTRLYGITFQPLGMHPLLRTDAHEFKNAFTDLDSLFGKSGQELIERVSESPDFSTVVAHFNRFLIHNISEEDSSKAHVHQAFRRLIETNGSIRISSLSKVVYVSERKLQRDFRMYTGISVERMAKMIRMKSTLKLLQSGRFKNYHELCDRLQYYDPSHLIHDIQRYTDLPIRNLNCPDTKIMKALLESH